MWGSTINMQSNTNIGAEGTSVLALTGPLTGNFNWTKVGNGTVLLAPTVPANSTYNNVIVGNGFLAFANSSTAALNGRIPTINSGGGLGLFWDGLTPTGDQETYLFPAVPATF